MGEEGPALRPRHQRTTAGEAMKDPRIVEESDSCQGKRPTRKELTYERRGGAGMEDVIV